MARKPATSAPVSPESASARLVYFQALAEMMTTKLEHGIPNAGRLDAAEVLASNVELLSPEIQDALQRFLATSALESGGSKIERVRAAKIAIQLLNRVETTTGVTRDSRPTA